MRLSIQFATLALCSFFSFSCGSPSAGTSCNVSGFVCESSASVLECQAGTWVSLPCKGPNGCSREGDMVKCDMTGNVANDACPAVAETKGFCTADNQGALQCLAGKLVLRSCRTCSVSNEQVTCTP